MSCFGANIFHWIVTSRLQVKNNIIGCYRLITLAGDMQPFFYDRVSLVMDLWQEDILERYYRVILEILTDHSEGLTEYKLIEELRNRGYSEFREGLVSGTLGLFQSHFLLFHILYSIRGKLRIESSMDMDIHCLKILLKPDMSNFTTLPGEVDNLQAYYMNLENLRDTNREDVDRMLEDFWNLFSKRDDLTEAYRLLNVDERTDINDVKRKYRNLVMEHHPDKGGDPNNIIALNAAMETINRFHAPG